MANTKITSKVIADGNVLTAAIADDAVTSAKVADDLALGGNPTTTTQSAGNNTTRIATTAFVSTAVANLVDSAPSALDTLNELAAALGDDANFSTTVTNSLAGKVALSGSGQTIADSGDLTIDAAGDIILDADGGEIKFRDGGVAIGQISSSNTDMTFYSSVQDRDMIFQGNDGGSAITALTLDMSDAGTAIFNNKVGIGTSSPSQILSLEAADTTVRFMEVKNSAGSMLVGINGSGNAFVSGQTSGKPLILETNNTERMRIDGSGNVGIGETSPDTQLHVKGTNNSAGDLYTAVGAGNTPSITIQNAGTTDNNNAALFFKNDSGMRASVGARFNSHSNEETQLRFATTDTSGSTLERMVLFGDGKLGINQFNPSNLLTVDVNSATAGTDSISVQNRGVTGVNHTAGLRFQFNTAVPAAIRSELKDTSNGKGTLQFLTSTDGTEGNLTQRAFIDTGGRFTFGGNFAHDTYGHVAVFGANSVPDGTIVVEDFDVSSGIGNTVMKCFLRDQDPATLATFIQFADGGGQVGSITHNDDGGGVSFNTTSDYRLKENVNYTWEALPLLKQLKPAKFNFKRNPAKTIQGMLAHEVQDIVPSSVRGDKDQIMPIGTVKDSEGNTIHEGVYEHFCKTDEKQTWTQTGTEPLYQNLDYSRLVPLLTKAIQEQQAVIEDLKTRIETLEG